VNPQRLVRFDDQDVNELLARSAPRRTLQKQSENRILKEDGDELN
jgi:hypothetical protein